MSTLTDLIRRANQLADAHFAKETDAFTARQHTVLRAIADRPGCSQTELVKDTGIDRSTTADLVRRLLNRGMIVRKRSKEDARSYVLTLTHLGERYLKAGDTIRDGAERKILDAIPAQLRKPFVSALHALSEPIKEAAE